MIINHLISTHGQQCSICPYGQDSNVFDLPENFVVVMNCKPTAILASPEIDAKVWEFATNKGLQDKLSNILLDGSIKKTKQILKEYLEYIQAILNKGENEYCMYFDQCPNMQVMREDKIFKSGVYTLPVEITYRPQNKQLTSKQFEDFSKSSYHGAQDIIANFLTPTYVDQSNYKITTYGIKQDHSDLSRYGVKNNTLQKYVNYINQKTNGKGFHVVFFVACACGKLDHTGYISELQNSNEKFLYKLMAYVLRQIDNNLCILSLDLINDTTQQSKGAGWRKRFEEAVENTTCKNEKKLTTKSGTNTNSKTNAFQQSNTKANAIPYEEPLSLTLMTTTEDATENIEFERSDVRTWLLYVGQVINELNKTSPNKLEISIQDNDDKNCTQVIIKDREVEEIIELKYTKNYNFSVKRYFFDRNESNRFFTYNKSKNTYTVTVTPERKINATQANNISIFSTDNEDNAYKFTEHMLKSFLEEIKKAVDNTGYEIEVTDSDTYVEYKVNGGGKLFDFVRFYKKDNNFVMKWYGSRPAGTHFNVKKDGNTLTVTFNTMNAQQGGFVLHKNKVYVAQGNKKFIVKLDGQHRPFIQVKSNKVLLTDIMHLKEENEKRVNIKSRKS